MAVTRREFLKLAFFSTVYFLTPFKGAFKERKTSKVEIYKRRTLRSVPSESVSYSHKRVKKKKLIELV